jgi:hypothetical protein
MQISFDYKKKQVLDALRNHFFSRPEIRVLMIVVNLFAILSAILFYFNKVQGLSFLIFSLLWFLLWLNIRVLLPNNIYKKSHTFKDEFTVDISNAGLRLQTSVGSQSWDWTAFSGYRESLYFFHLYFDKRSYFLIPKDSFSSFMEEDEARTQFKTSIKGK